VKSSQAKRREEMIVQFPEGLIINLNAFESNSEENGCKEGVTSATHSAIVHFIVLM
jgi:hypothetical protein